MHHHVAFTRGRALKEVWQIRNVLISPCFFFRKECQEGLFIGEKTERCSTNGADAVQIHGGLIPKDSAKIALASWQG